MRVFVTGATGAVGRYVVPYLAEAGYEVVAFSRTLQSDVDPRGGQVRLAVGDVRDSLSVARAVEGVDAIVHLAGVLEDRGEVETFETNIRGTYNVLDAARSARIRRVVVTSSIAVTGCLVPAWTPQYLPIDEAHPCSPLTPYALSKQLTESLCRYYAARHGMVLAILRVAGVHTPESWVQPLWDEIRCPIIWTWIHPHDVAEAIRRCLATEFESPLLGNLAASDTCSLRPTSSLAGTYFPDATIRRKNPADGQEQWPFFTSDVLTTALGWEPAIRFGDVYCGRRFNDRENAAIGPQSAR
jgi:nucleoside-diphosphate-sugar epimerase